MSGRQKRDYFRNIQKDIINAVSEPLAFIDKDYTYVFVNAAYGKYFKKSPEKIQGMKVYELTGEEYFNKTVKTAIDRCLQGENLTYESVISTPDGGTYNVLVDMKTHFNAEGEIDGVISSSKNTTLQKEAEKALRESETTFRQLAENINQVFWLTDWKNKKLLYLSPAYEDIYELSRQSAFEDPTSWRQVVHPDDLERVNKVFSGRPGPDQVIASEYRIHTKSGKLKWIFDRSYPVCNEKGEVVRIVSLAEDITQRKQTEEALRESEKKLREANIAKDKFFSIIAHDLRSPFNSIMGYTDLMLQKSRKGQTGDVLKISSILNDVARQSYDLLNNLLEWSRSQTQNLSFQPRRINLAEIIDEVVSFSETSAKQKGIRLLRRYEQVDVSADENMMRTIIRNLLSNAVKFTNSGGIISIIMKEVVDDVEVVVKDTGVGISGEEQKKLFHLGEDVSKSGTRMEKGSGLGLVLCKEFVEMHGGRIGFISEEGKGSTFYFSIPRIVR